jgi:hypothetical protein
MVRYRPWTTCISVCSVAWYAVAGKVMMHVLEVDICGKFLCEIRLVDVRSDRRVIRGERNLWAVEVGAVEPGFRSPVCQSLK